MRAFPIVLLVLVLLAAGAVAGVRYRWIDVPPAWSPWEPLDVSAPPGFFTRYKLSRLGADADACRAVLTRTAMSFETVPDRSTGENCGFTDAVILRALPTAVGEEFSATCRTAVSIAMWETHVLQPAAMRYFGERVARVDHFGSYSCRNVYGRPDATRSRHATAEAWDVAGFVLAGGRRIRIANDWKTTTPEAAFLREIRDGACSFFDGVLSPDYNQAHHDHLHLDRGPYRMCR